MEDTISCTLQNILKIFKEAGLSCNHRVLGSQLGLSTSHLDEIEHLPYQQRMTQILEKTADIQGLSWSLLVSVLRKSALKEMSAATYIERHCLTSSSTASDSPSTVVQPLSITMSSSQVASLVSYVELTIPNVVNEIADIYNWQELGIFLEMDNADILTISGYHQKEQHQRLVETWFSRDPDKSWEKIHRAKKLTSAARSRSHVTTHSTSFTPHMIPLDIESRFDSFERRFKHLQLAARKELELKINSVEIVRDELTVLPSVIMKEHHKCVTAIAKRVKPFPSLTLFFQYLNLNGWNFFEYKLLSYLINNNCSKNLKAEMASYEYDMRDFQQKTTVNNFIEYGRNRIVLKERSVPPRFKKLILKKGIDPDSYTLAELDNFRQKTCAQLKLSECALLLYSIKHNCIIVEWIFPEEITEILSCFYSHESGQELLQNHRVESISIDETSLNSWVLQVAIKNNDRDKTLSILQKDDPNINLNCKDWVNDVTPILVVAERGDVEIVTILSDEGADQNTTDKDGRTSLMVAVKAGHREVVEVLLEPRRNCQVNLQEKVSGWSALHFAAHKGHMEIVEILTNPVVKANLLLRDNDGKTALSLAQEQGHTQVVEFLQSAQDHEKQAGAGESIWQGIVNFFRWSRKKNKLVIAAKSGSIHEVQAFLDDGTDPNTPDEKHQWTPLMYACQNGHTEVVNLLLERGADPNWRAVQGWNALILASQLGYDDIVKLLLTKGRCDPNIQTTTKGWTALHGLCRYTIGSSKGNVYAKGKSSDKYIRTVKLLLEHGADVTKKEKTGWTPLMIACKNGLLEIAKLLVEAIKKLPDAEKQKALDQTKEKDSWSALMEACDKGNTDIAKILVDAGASLTLKNKDGALVLHIAVKRGDDEMVKDLLAAALKRKVNLNLPDKVGMTPLELAKKEKKDRIRQNIQTVLEIMTQT